MKLFRHLPVRLVAAVFCVTAAAPRMAAAQTVLVPGDTSVNGARIKIGTEKFKITGTRAGPSYDMATLTQIKSIVTVNGQRALRVIQIVQGRIGNSTDTSIAVLRTLAPLTFRSHNEGGFTSVDFKGKSVTGKHTPSEGGAAQKLDRTFADVVYDSNLLDFIVGAAPLRKGYVADIPVYAFEANGSVLFSMKVEGEKVVDRVPAWDVTITMPTGVLRYAIAKSDRRVLGAWYDGRDGVKTVTTPIAR